MTSKNNPSKDKQQAIQTALHQKPVLCILHRMQINLILAGRAGCSS